jgi:mannose-1-phosphate guanylyltransferase
MSAIDHFWAVVPAGGAGTRLWPLSRSGAPKFLHDLTGTGRTLLQGTWDRLVPLSEERFLVVTGRKHRPAVLDQLPDADPARVLAEPSPRDSMAAIGLAAALLERADPEAVMGSFAADHVIPDAAAFADVLRVAVEVARDDWLVTLGIEPTFPSSAFGYIRLGDALEGHPGAHAVDAFVEKPSVRTATDYLATGRYRWNAGMFVVRPTVLLDLLGRWHPEFAAALRRIAADPDALDERLAAEWADLPKIAVDHAVAEPAADAGRVACVPASFGWEDVGDFDSLASLLADGAAADGAAPGGGGADGDAAATTTVLGAEALVRAIDSTGLVVPAGGRVVAVVGLEDVVVVDTPDALLVTTRARAQDVKQVVAELKESGSEHLT